MIEKTMTGAISAYNKAAKIGANSISSPEKPQASGAFGEMLKNLVTTTVEANREGERLSMKAIAGEADIREVVAAVANAEMALETVVAVRDSVIKAYQEILRMPI